MDDFLVRGCHFLDRSKILALKLPPARDYKIVTVKNTDEILQPLKLIREAVRMRKRTFLKRGWSPPVIYQGYDSVYLHGSLHQILAKHPFPLRQGPFIPQLACTIYSNQTENQMLTEKTIFSHCESQECGEWIPIHSGLDGWGNISPNAKKYM